MKQIIFDHFRRRRLAFTLIGAFYFLFADFVFFIPFQSLLNQAIFYTIIFQTMIVFLGFFLNMDLQCGLARVMTTLPVTTKQVGRAWWTASVAIPAAGLLTVGFLALLVFAILENKVMSLGSHLVACVCAVPTLGAMFGAMTFTRTAIPETFIARIGVFFSNFFLMLLFFSLFIFNKTNLNLTVVGLIFAVLTILTFIGWFRAEQLVVERAGFRIASRQLKKTGQFKPSTGFGGIRYIFASAFFRVWSFGIYFFIIMNILNFVIKHQFDWHHLTRSMGNGGSFLPFFFVFIFMSSAISLSLSHTLRFLRTMPVSTARLAAVLLSVLILPMLTLVLAFTALAWKETGADECISFFKIELLAIAPVSVFIAVSIWNSQVNFIKTVLLAILIVATMSPAFYQLACMDGRDGLPFWFINIFDAAIVGLAFWSTCKIIAKSSSAYCPRQNQLGNRWSWLGAER